MGRLVILKSERPDMGHIDIFFYFSLDFRFYFGQVSGGFDEHSVHLF